MCGRRARGSEYVVCVPEYVCEGYRAGDPLRTLRAPQYVLYVIALGAALLP